MVRRAFVAAICSLVLTVSMSPNSVLAAKMTKYCQHNIYKQHCSMRPIRVTTRYNPIENKYQTLDWYICVFCNYEDYWVEPEF